jgi:hypothetical protein
MIVFIILQYRYSNCAVWNLAIWAVTPSSLVFSDVSNSRYNESTANWMYEESYFDSRQSQEIFFISEATKTTCGAHPAMNLMDGWGKVAGGWSRPLIPKCIEAKNKCSCTSTPSYTFMASTEITSPLTKVQQVSDNCR